MKNNPNISRVATPVFTEFLGLGHSRKNNHQALAATGAVAVNDWHSTMFVAEMEKGNPASDLVLFDGGYDKNAYQLKRYLAMREVGLRVGQPRGADAITKNLITHAHPDHVGAVHAINSQTYISEADSKVLSGDSPSEGQIPSLLHKLGISRVAFPGLVPELITQDQEFIFGELTVRAIAVAGHTGGSMAFLVRRGLEDQPSDLIVGDALDFRRDGSVVNAHKRFSGDTEASEQSIIDLSRYLIELGIMNGDVGTGHSGVGTIEAIHNFKRAA